MARMAAMNLMMIFMVAPASCYNELQCRCAQQCQRANGLQLQLVQLHQQLDHDIVSNSKRAKNQSLELNQEENASKYTLHLVVSLTKGPQYKPQYTIVLIMGTPKKVPPNFGKP